MEELITGGSTEEKLPSDQKEDARIRTLDKWYIQACEAEEGFLEQAFEDQNFYMGKQWDPNDVAKMREEKRPALTYNYIFSIINVINGYHRQNKLDMKVFNRRGGSREVAEILTRILKHIKQTRNGDWEVSYAHLLGLITGKSYLCLGIDYEEDVLNGELFLEYSSCFDIKVDPFGSRYDLTDRDYFCRSVWMPKQKIEMMYPKKIDPEKMQVLDADRRAFQSDVETFTYQEAQEYHLQNKEDIEQYRYKVKEFWWKEYEQHKFLVNVMSGTTKNVTEMPDKAIKRVLAARPEWRQIKRTRPVLWMNQYIGLSELTKTKMPMGGMRKFPLVGFFPYFVGSQYQGMVTQLKDPQREHNKRMSQALHHLNSSANSGYTADEDAVDNWDELERNISKPGYIKKIKPGKRFDKDQPADISQGHVLLAQTGANALKSISGVNSDLLGQGEKEIVSGVAIARRQAQGLIATEIVQDNLKLTLKILGDRMTEAIQKSGAYSQEEVLYLVVDGNESEAEINKKTQETGRVLNDVRVGRYETTMETSIQTPTARFANYQALVEAIKSGVPIPPDVLIEASDIPNKEQVLKKMQESAKQQMQMKQMEIQQIEKDRQLEILKIQAKTQGEIARDRQKARNDLMLNREKIADQSKADILIESMKGQIEFMSEAQLLELEKDLEKELLKVRGNRNGKPGINRKL